MPTVRRAAGQVDDRGRSSRPSDRVRGARSRGAPGGSPPRAAARAAARPSGHPHGSSRSARHAVGPLHPTHPQGDEGQPLVGAGACSSGCSASGTLIILLNYVELLPTWGFLPDGTSNVWLLDRPGADPRRDHRRHPVALRRAAVSASSQAGDRPWGESHACNSRVTQRGLERHSTSGRPAPSRPCSAAGLGDLVVGHGHPHLGAADGAPEGDLHLPQLPRRGRLRHRPHQPAQHRPARPPDHQEEKATRHRPSLRAATSGGTVDEPNEPTEGQPSRSMIVAFAIPPPSHIVSRP